jgi:hypothetical protein
VSGLRALAAVRSPAWSLFLVCAVCLSLPRNHVSHRPGCGAFVVAVCEVVLGRNLVYDAECACPRGTSVYIARDAVEGELFGIVV